MKARHQRANRLYVAVEVWRSGGAHVEMIESDRREAHYWSDHPRGGFPVILNRIRQRADGFEGFRTC